MKKKSCFKLIIFVIIIIVVFNVFHSYNNKLSLGTKICNYILIPFKSVNNFYKNSKVYFVDKRKISSEILTLRQENVKLKIENQELKYLADKSDTLEQLMGFKKSIYFKPKGAHILYNSPNHWYNKAFIDLGEKDNIKVGFALVTKNGIVGQISKTSDFSSEISPITNENTALGGINSNKVKGLVTGNGSEYLTLSYIKLNSNIKVGDTIFTYGDNTLIPSGIPIGKVISISQDKITSSLIAKLEPIENFGYSDLLFVLIPVK